MIFLLLCTVNLVVGPIFLNRGSFFKLMPEILTDVFGSSCVVIFCDVLYILVFLFIFQFTIICFEKNLETYDVTSQLSEHSFRLHNYGGCAEQHIVVCFRELSSLSRLPKDARSLANICTESFFFSKIFEVLRYTRTD